MEKNPTSHEILTFRFPAEMTKLIRRKAGEEKTSMSGYVRRVLMDKLNEDYSMQEIMVQNLQDAKKRLKYLEEKIDVFSVITFELARLVSGTLPDMASFPESVREKKYESFMNSVRNQITQKHGGFLESMVLDLYEQTPMKEDGTK